MNIHIPFVFTLKTYQDGFTLDFGPVSFILGAVLLALLPLMLFS